MKTKELYKKSIEELDADLLSMLRKQFDLRMQIATGQSQQIHLLRQMRRDIARISTVLDEKIRVYL